MSISQISLVLAIQREIERQGVQCDIQTMNKIVASADSLIAEIKRPRIKADHLMSLTEWLMSDDTGSSSKWLANTIFRLKCYGPHYPYDPDDFGRCIRMLRNVAGAQVVFDENKEYIKEKGGPVWVLYINAWEKLVSLYDEENQSGMSRLYNEMDYMQKQAQLKQSNQDRK